jgi:hypothetical protein
MKRKYLEIDQITKEMELQQKIWREEQPTELQQKNLAWREEQSMIQWPKTFFVDVARLRALHGASG